MVGRKIDEIKLSSVIQGLLRCPACLSALQRKKEYLECNKNSCLGRYPIFRGVPLLIDEEKSLFKVDDVQQGRNSFLGLAREKKYMRFLKAVAPTISKNIKGKKNFRKLVDILLKKNKNPRVLIIGGRVLGQGMGPLFRYSCIEIVESDVSLGPRTKIVCDSHSLPFQAGSFDAVIVQAVLEHVVDPSQCVEEIHRVLGKEGLVYGESPFMAQVHGGSLDFTRFTHLGHRRLFRKFEEIDSGAVCGPGMALAWSYEYFLLSFVRSRMARLFVQGFARCTSFFLKYFDYLLIDMPGSLDAASGYYFLGRKSEKVLSDRELVKLYRGGRRS